MSDLQKILDDLRKPFHPSQVQWKPGAVKGDRALAMAYADLRAYMNRLDDVTPDWEVVYEPWGEDRIICKLTIGGVTRASTGESDKDSEKNEIGGTSAEAQAFKRAAAMFGLGRYLYLLPTGWADYDPATKRFTDKAKARLTGMLVQHYRRATDANVAPDDKFAADAGEEEAEPEHPEAQGTPPHNRFWGLGKSVFGNDWDMAREWLISKWTARNTPDNTRNSASELTDDEKTQLGDYMNESVSALQEAWRKQKKFIEQHKVTP